MKNRDTFFGVHQYKEADVRKILKPGAKILFSNLAGFDLSGLDLSKCYFLACILDNTDFRGSNLLGARFDRCFVSKDERLPIILGATLENVCFEEGNLFWREEGIVRTKTGYDEEIRKAATGSKEEAIEMLRFYNALPIDKDKETPLLFALAHLLNHKSENVRNSAFHCFCDLHYLFFESDTVEHYFREHLLRSAGEESDLIYQDAGDLIEKYGYSDKIIRGVVNQIHSKMLKERLNGLRAINQMKNKGDWYDRLVEFREVVGLLESENKEIILETLKFALRHSSWREREQNIQFISQQLRSLLDCESKEILTFALSIIAGAKIWEDKSKIYPLLESDFQEVRIQAWDTLFSVLPSGELMDFLLQNPVPRAKHLFVMESEPTENDDSESRIITKEKLSNLLQSSNEKLIKKGLKLLTFLRRNQNISLIIRHCQSKDEGVLKAAHEALSYYAEEVEEGFVEIDEGIIKGYLSGDDEDLLKVILLLKYVPDKKYVGSLMSDLRLHANKQIRTTLIRHHYLIFGNLDFIASFLQDASSEVVDTAREILEGLGTEELKTLAEGSKFKKEIENIIGDMGYYRSFFDGR